jgi:hypothetical protein
VIVNREVVCFSAEVSGVFMSQYKVLQKSKLDL